MNLRHDTCKISHAYAYRGVQILDYKTYFCAFIPQKLNKLRRLFFIFPITFAVVSEPGKISHLGVKFRGLQCPKKAPRSQNFKIFTVSARLLWPKGRHGASLVPLFCTTMGGRARNLRKSFPFSLKNLRGRGQFFDCAVTRISHSEFFDICSRCDPLPLCQNSLTFVQ